MKTFNKFKRVCAMTLTALMIIQQSNVTTFASDIEAAAEAMAQSEEEQNAADGSENNTAAETTSQETPAQTEPVQTESAQPEQVQEQQQQETTPATEQQPAVTPEIQKTTADTANAAQEQEATPEAQPVATEADEEMAVQAAGETNNSIAVQSLPEYNFGDYAASVEVSVKKGANAYNPDSSYDLNQTFDAVMQFVLSNDKINGLKTLLENSTDEKITFIYKMPDSVIGFDSHSESLTTQDGQTVIGTYEIENDGRTIKFSFNRDFFINNSSITGKCDYYFHVNKEEIDEEDKISISFPGVAAPVIIKINSSAASVEKSHTVDADGNFTFSIPVTGGETATRDVKIKDVPGSNLEIDYDSISLDGQKVTATKNEDGSFSVDVGTVPAKTTKTLTYTAKIKNKNLVDSDGNVKNLENKVKWTSSGQNEQEKTDWGNVTNKTGEKSKNQKQDDPQCLDWTVSLNNGTLKKNMNGAAYVDTMNSDNQRILSDTIRVKTADGVDITDQCTISPDVNGKTFTVSFPSDLGENNKKEYKITYTSRTITDIAGDEKATGNNNGTLNGNPIKGSDFNYGLPEVKDNLQKSGQYLSDENKIQWTSVYTPVTKVVNPVFKDALLHGGYNDKGELSWAQGYQDSVFDEESFVIIYDGRPLDKGSDYTIAFNRKNALENVGNDQFEIQFKGSFSKPITITYKSKIFTKGGESNTVYNTCYINGKSVEANVYYTVKKTIVKRGGYSKENGKNYLNWTILANVSDIQNPDHPGGEVDFGGKIIQITDTLPEGVKFVSATYKKSADWNGWNTAYEIVPAIDGRKLTFTILDVHKDLIQIDIKTEITDFDYDENSEASYTNVASWGIKDEDELDNTDKTVNVKSEILKKNGTVSENKQNVIYTIKVNSDGYQLTKEGKAGNGVLRLTDTLPKNVTYVSSEIKGQDGNTIDGAQIAVIDGVLTAVIPDETPAVITYTVKPILTGTPDDSGNYYIQIDNAVELSGTSFVKSEDNKQYTVRGASASAGGDRHLLSVEKTDALNQNIKLSGAEFVLKKILFNSDGTSSENEVTKVTTSEKGKAQFKDLQLDQVYCYEETKAPVGYELKSGKTYICVKDQESSFNEISKKFATAYPGETLVAYSGGEKITITNVRKSSADIVAKKVLEGADLRAYQFEFNITEVKDETGAALENPYTENVAADAQGNINFSTINYSEEGIHYYQISEIKGSSENITYDEHKFIVKVEVAYNNLLQRLESIMTYPSEDGVVFTNTYTKPALEATSAQFEVAKVVSGEGAPDEEFTFTLAGIKDAPMPEATSIQVKAKETKSFGKIKYTKAGTYEYTITETKGTTAGMTYDESVHKVVVTVTEVDGKLTAAVTYDGKAIDKLTVTNTYEKPEKPAPEATSAQFEVEKVVSGEGAPDEEFTFTLEGKDNAPMPTEKKLKVKAGASEKFGEITYTSAETYEYTITETKGTTAGMTYDGTAHKVVVTVTEAEGKLTAAVTYDGKAADKLTVTNTYEKPEKPAPTATTAQFEVEKVVSGEGAPDEEFTFTLEGKDNAPMPTEKKLKVKAGASEKFGEITYTSAGTYECTITETKGTTAGMTYDETAHKVVVTVTEVEGKLTAAVTYDGKVADKLTVTNTYEKPAPEATKAEIKVTKTVKGEGAPEEEFEFTLEGKDGAPMPAQATVKATAGETKSFGEITYTVAGTYKYTVKETKGATKGMTYDESGHEVVVTVAEKDGKLAATVSYDKKQADSLTVTNTYEKPAPEATEAQITAKKTVNGETAKGSLFQFTLTPKTAGDANKAQTVRNADGTITFNKLTYETAGTYVYEVSEVQEVPAGYTADTVKHEVTVEVADKDGQLVAAVKYAEADKDGIVFANQYKPLATEAQITAKKTVNGETAKGSLFQFTLTPKTAGDANKAQTVRNADGNITFNKLTYETAGTYKYEVSENQDVPTGYTADTKTHEVTVEVADKDGQLVAAVKYAEADKDGIVFENTYEKTFKIRKTDIGGKELKDAKFVLSGKEEGGKDITPISWTSDGTAKEITVKSGTYTLEETAAPEGYNTIQSKVTITVDKEGKVTVTGSAEITVNGKKVSEVSAEGDEIIVKDTLKGSSITVTKNLVHNGEALEAINATFYVALYNDEACTDRASDVKAIEFKNASASTASFTDVKVGKEYYVAECDENGNALTTGEIAGATFMANFSSSNKVSVEKENDSSIIYFTNEFLTIPDGFYKEAKLTITKKLLGTDGKAKNGDGKFYAGIFMDKDHTELADSNTVSANIVELDLNDVSEASQTVKFGVGKNDKLTFYIAETDAEGNPVADDEDFSYKVTYSAESATFDITHLSAAVTIVNRETSSEKTEVTETTNKTSGSPNSTAKTAVKTGDDTPILPFVIILLAAIAAIVVFVKKRFGSKKN